MKREHLSRGKKYVKHNQMKVVELKNINII